MSLYDLPKDILIKIITTVSEDYERKLAIYERYYGKLVKCPFCSKDISTRCSAKCVKCNCCICNLHYRKEYRYRCEECFINSIKMK